MSSLTSSSLLEENQEEDASSIKWHTLNILSNESQGPKSTRRRSRKWSQTEDELLRRMVEEEIIMEGGNMETFLFERVRMGFWLNVSNAVNENNVTNEYKSRDSCRNRWMQHLQHNNLRQDRMSEKEIYLILLAIDRLKTKYNNSLPRHTWKKLSLAFPGRNEVDIKNAYQSFQRQKIVAHDLGDNLDKSKLRPRDINNSNNEIDFWANDDDTLWLKLSNAMKENDRIQSQYVNKKRRRLNTIETEQNAYEKKKRKRTEELLLNIAEDAIHHLTRESSSSSNSSNNSTMTTETTTNDTYGESNEMDLDDLIGMQPLSNLRIYARKLGIKLKHTSKVMVVGDICKAIYENNELLDNMMKLLNENNVLDSSINEHTFTIIEENHQQQQEEEQSNDNSGGEKNNTTATSTTISVTMSPTKPVKKRSTNRKNAGNKDDRKKNHGNIVVIETDDQNLNRLIRRV